MERKTTSEIKGMNAGLREHKSGKGERDENFPVASFLISPHQRPAMKAYYRFARSADDAADNKQMSSKEKLRCLDQLEKTLLGFNDNSADAVPLRKILLDRGLSNQCALDLLVAFRQDVIKSRYETWDELLEYCSFSANPVGRFILQIHGETPSIFPESDVLCTTLQIINHLQDCKKDYVELDRIYIPLEEFCAENIHVNELGKEQSCFSLKRIFERVILKTMNLKPDFEGFSEQVRDRRLSLEIAVISRLAKHLLHILSLRDPLKEKVHLSKLETFSLGVHEILVHLKKRYLS